METENVGKTKSNKGPHPQRHAGTRPNNAMILQYFESSSLDARCKVKRHLQVVGDEQLPQVVHLQHGGSVVLTDAVALQQVLGGHHLPGQPAQVESSVARQHVGQVAGLAAAARVVLLHALCDGFYLSLLAVCA